MSIVTDIEVISPEKFEELKKIKGENLVDVIHDNLELTLIFEKHTVTVSSQDSDDYGTNTFWEIEKNKKKFVAVRHYYRRIKLKSGGTKLKLIRAHLRHNKQNK